jgi:hypothetical protein
MPVFADGAGTRVLERVQAVHVRSIGAPLQTTHDNVFLTRGATDYTAAAGSEVTWLWGTDVIGPAWYLHPTDVLQGPVTSVEFRGIPLEALA